MTSKIQSKNKQIINSIPKRTKLESEFSLKPLINLAKREGNHKKPIYQMHKWWARRLGVNFRFLLLSAISSSNIHEKTLWRRFFKSDMQLGITVLDPFMGGGTSIVEATKLGAKTIGIDIDPLAWFIVSKQINKFDEKDFLICWESIQKDISEKIRKYYLTEINGKFSDVINYFWVELIPCQSCGYVFEGHINYLLYSKKNNNGTLPSRLGFCKKCHKLYPLYENEKVINCSCGEQTNVENGNLYLGKYTCPNCHHQAKLNTIPNSHLPLQIKLFAVEYIDPDSGKRAYKKADETDQALYKKASEDLLKLWKDLPIPNQIIPIYGRKDPRPISLGYKKYYELFNDRQLLCLTIILKKIIEIENPNHRELLLLAFSDSLACNNRFCSYAFGYQKLTPLFGLHAFRRISRPVEANVWGTIMGRGSFSSCVEKVIRGKRYAANSFEYMYEKGKPIQIKTDESAFATIVDDIQTFSKLEGKTTYLKIADSRDLFWLPEKSIDMVLTDPPYYDNISYSEMADFYLTWIKDYVQWNINPNSVSSPLHTSLFVRKNDNIEHQKYSEGLAKSFLGCRKAIKDSGIMVFTYHHSNRKAWESLAYALCHADFRVTNCFPVLSEGKSGFHSDSGNLKWDVVFVCRPGINEYYRVYKPGHAKKWLKSHYNKWLNKIQLANVPFGPLDKRSFAYGLSISYITNCKVTKEEIIDVLKQLEKIIPSIIKPNE